MKKASAVARRTLLVLAGAVLAGVAVLLILWGLRALRSAPGETSRGDEARPEAATPARRGEKAEESLPRWQEYTRGGLPGSDPATAALRPLAGLASAVGSPFDQAYYRRQLLRLRLRLEGVGWGPQPLALISGRVVGIGDRIEDFRVESIGRSGVSLVDSAGFRVDLQPQVWPPSPRELPAEPAAAFGRERRPAGEPTRERLSPSPGGKPPRAPSEIVLERRQSQKRPGRERQ